MSGIEILGIAASVLQIADAGARLSSKLFIFTRKIKNADRTISDISQEIAATGAALRELGEALEQDKYASLGSKYSVDTTSQIVADCWKVFTDINETIGGEKIIKESPSNDERLASWSPALSRFNRPSFSLKQRLKFPYIEPQIMLLKSKLEGLKSSLMLMLQVLMLAEQVRYRPQVAVTEEQKALIQTLIEERNEKEKEFRSSYLAIETSTDTNPSLDTFNNGSEQSTLVAAHPSASDVNLAPYTTDDTLCEAVEEFPGTPKSVMCMIATRVPDHSQPLTATDRSLSAGSLEPAAMSADTSSLRSLNSSITKLTPTTSMDDASNSTLHGLPAVLRIRQEEIQHHAQLVHNLLEEISDVQYRIDHGIRHRMHDGVLRTHWDEWEPFAQKHGHDHFLDVFEKSNHRHISRYWLDKNHGHGVTRIVAASLSEKKEPPPVKDRPILRFIDCIGRPFNLPFRSCHKWEDMQAVITSTFAHIEDLDTAVAQGRYELHDSLGAIILPQFWESSIEPGMEIKMFMWPKPAPSLANGDVIDLDALTLPTRAPKGKRRSSKGNARHLSDSEMSVFPSPAPGSTSSKERGLMSVRTSKRKQRESETLPTERPPSSSLTVKIFVTIADELELDISEIEEDTVWEDIGLDSLMALTISDRLRRELGIEAESSMFSLYPTANALRTHYDATATGNAAKDAETRLPERDSWPEDFSRRPSFTFRKDSDTFSNFNMKVDKTCAADMDYYSQGAARKPESSGAPTPIYGMEYGDKEDAAADNFVDFSDSSDDIQVLDARGVQESDGTTPFYPQDAWQGRERESQDGFGDATEEPGDWEKPVFVNEKQFFRILKRRVARQKLEEQFESSKPGDQKSAADDGSEDSETTAEVSLKQPCSKDVSAPSAIKTASNASPDEASLALANTSLEFSLCMMSPPMEYQGLEKETPHGIDAASALAGPTDIGRTSSISHSPGSIDIKPQIQGSDSEKVASKSQPHDDRAPSAEAETTPSLSASEIQRDASIKDVIRNIQREKFLLDAAKNMRQITKNLVVVSRLDSRVKDSERNIAYLEEKLHNLQTRQTEIGTSGTVPSINALCSLDDFKCDDFLSAMPPSSETHDKIHGDLSMEFKFFDLAPEKGLCPHPDCSKIFRDLKAHMLTHQIERPEKCPVPSCEYSHKGFARKYDKNRHVLTHYKGTMVCGFCPGSGTAAEKSFNRTDVFKRHLTNVHCVLQIPPNSWKRRTRSSSSEKQLLNYCQDATGKCSTCLGVFGDAQVFYEHLDDCVMRAVQSEVPGNDSDITPDRAETNTADTKTQGIGETASSPVLPGPPASEVHKPTEKPRDSDQDAEKASFLNYFFGKGDNPPPRPSSEVPDSLVVHMPPLKPVPQPLMPGFASEAPSPRPLPPVSNTVVLPLPKATTQGGRHPEERKEASELETVLGLFTALTTEEIRGVVEK